MLDSNRIRFAELVLCNFCIIRLYCIQVRKNYSCCTVAKVDFSNIFGPIYFRILQMHSMAMEMHSMASIKSQENKA